MEDPYAPPPDAPERGRDGARSRGQRPARSPQGSRSPEAPRAPRAPRTPPPAPDPEALRVVQRRMGTFLLLVLAALLTSRLRLPWQLGSLAFVLVALGTGIWALTGARRPGVREQVVPMLVVGLVFTAMLALSMSSSLILWSEQMTRQECLDHAVTLSSADACDTAYQDAVERRLDELTNPRRD